MLELNCTSLDDYLAGDLPPGGNTAFESHLSNCDACRQAVADWKSLRTLLQAGSRSVEPHERLAGRIERLSQLQRERETRVVRRRRLVLCAAACACLAVFLLSVDSRRTKRNERTDLVSSTPSPPVREAHATVKTSDDIIAVPIDIDDPKVTVVWLYPTVRNKIGTN